MIEGLLQWAAMLACAVIFTRAEPAINRMYTGTPILLVIAMHFLTVGPVGVIGSILIYDTVPDLASVISLIGVAALLVCERRVRVLTGALTKPPLSDSSRCPR